MSRVIKFRAWDGSHMRYPSDDTHLALFSGPKRVPWRIYSNHDGTMLTDAEYGGVLMQFTGLHDRNGNEIYEGDVVEAKNWNHMRYTVEFIEGGFCLTNLKMAGWPIDINLMFSSVGAACAVIGNIHENPEPLKP